MLPFVYQNPEMDFHLVLKNAGYKKTTLEDIKKKLKLLKEKFQDIKTSKNGMAEQRWLIGQIKPTALGNVDLREIKSVTEEI